MCEKIALPDSRDAAPPAPRLVCLWSRVVGNGLNGEAYLLLFVALSSQPR